MHNNTMLSDNDHIPKDVFYFIIGNNINTMG